MFLEGYRRAIVVRQHLRLGRPPKYQPTPRADSRDRGDHMWAIPRSWVGLERVGYRNGIHCTLAFNRRWFQHVAFGGWRKLVSDRRALIRVCLAHRLPLRAVDIITFMAFPVRGTSLPLQR